MNNRLIKSVAEVGSVVSLVSLGLSSVIAFFSFESIGINFFQVASVEDTILIGIGFLAALIPVLLLLWMQYYVVKALLGAAYAFSEKSKKEHRTQRRARAVLYLVSNLLYVLAYLAMALLNLSYSYTNIYYLLAVLLAAISLPAVFLFSTNFLIRRDLVDFGQTDPYYYLQANESDLSEEARALRGAFTSRVFKHLVPLALLSCVLVLSFSMTRPLKGDSSFVGESGGFVTPECVGSPVVWSGTRSIVYECDEQFFIIHGPENVNVISTGENTLERRLERFFDQFSVDSRD